MTYTTTLTRSALTISGLLFSSLVMAQAPDLTAGEKPVVKSVVKSTVRFHSKGIFNYGGRIACENPSADANFVFERKQFGFQIFKAIDLVDHSSPNNFLLAAVYRNFKLSKRLTFTPYVATFLEQQHSFAGHGSDLGLITTTAWKVSKHFTLDHTMLIGNLMVDPEERDWVNRFRVVYTNNHLDVTGTFWHNNPVFDEFDYTSGAISVAYNRVKLNDHFNLNFAVTEMGIVSSSNEEAYPVNNKLVFSVAAQFVK